MSKEVILTGLRANNDLHIGNYLGALSPMVDMATKHAGRYQINLFVPDLHSFTTPIDHSKLQEGIMKNLRVFVAAGLPLDNPDIHLYRQSYIPAHSELTWILNCFTGFGEMSRMTQFKEKSGVILPKADAINLRNEIIEKLKAGGLGESLLNSISPLIIGTIYKHSHREQHTSVGLFNYPVLMAADILLYNAMYIPVGDDQTQHLEFTRDIAQRINRKFGSLFVVPKSVKEQHAFFGKDQGLRIRDLTDPAKKMSKSDKTGKGVIFLTDTPEVARKKIMSAATDSLGDIQHDYSQQPGISNLLDIYRLLGGDPQEFIGQSQYGALKSAVADKVAAFLEDFQFRLSAIDDNVILEKLTASEAAMTQQANSTLYNVQQAVGLR